MSLLQLDSPVQNDQSRILGLQLVTYFQPICSIKTRAVVGLEALIRGIDVSGQIVSPARIFDAAAKADLTVAVERFCRRRAAATFADTVAADDPLLLFVNLNLQATSGEDDVESMLAILRKADVPPSSVVIEVLESRIENSEDLIARMTRFRQNGFLLALDDVGAGHSNLDRVAAIRPDILKVDRELIRNVDSDHYKQGTLKSLVHLSRSVGALVVAEGIETTAEAMTALDLGADLLQGFALARPQSPEQLSLAAASNNVTKMAATFKSYMVDKINDRKRDHRRYNVLINSVLCELTRTKAAEFDAVLQQTMLAFPRIECMYVLDESGAQVSDTIFRPGCRCQRNRTLFRAAARGTDHSLKDYYYLLLDAELQKYTTEPYVSIATGNICRTISTCFRDGQNNRLYVLCIDVEST